MTARRRRRHPLGHAVLQQADARKGSSSTTARSPTSVAAADHRLQRARPHRRATSRSATLVRLAPIPNIVGVKEASGNMTQMCEICSAVPARLPRALGRRCADAAADGGRRPRHHLGGVERDAGGDGADGRSSPSADDFAARARRSTRASAPADAGQLRRVEPGPGEGAMAAMGLLEEVYRLPMVPPRDASRAKIRGRAARRIGRCSRRPRRDDERSGRRHRVARRRRAPPPIATRPARCSRGCAQRCRRATCAPPNPMPSAPSGWRVNAWVKQGILLGFRFGDVVDVSADHGRWPFFDKDTLPLKRLDRRRRRPHRARRLDGPRRRVPRAAASSACRRCTSTSAPTSATAR